MYKIIIAVMFVLIGQVAEAAEPAPPTIYYKDGLHIDSADGNNTLLLNGRLQTRFTYNRQDAALDTNTFAVQRGEIRLDGNTFRKNLKYGFEVGFSTRAAAATSGVGFLNDYYIDYVGRDIVGVKVGQFKVPYLYSELASTMKQQFPDRALSHDNFTLARDLGVSLHGSLFDTHLNYALFGMNGDGQNAALNNTNRHFLTGVRFDAPIFGDYKYSESDVEFSEHPNMGVGVAYAFNERAATMQSASIGANTKVSDLTTDLYFKLHGFSLLGAGMLTRTHTGAHFTNWGYSGQAGYFITPQHFEVAGRAAGAVLKNGVANQYEYDVALNYYFNKHNLKWQTDCGMLKNVRGAGLTDHRIRSQLTVVF